MSRWSAGSDFESARQPLVLDVDQSSIGEARRASQMLALATELDDAVVARVALVATELATNVARHGRGGRLLVRPLHEARGLEFIAVDSGPGMADVQRALEDGYSTRGSSGAGLGAVRRIADAFDIWSQAGRGTVVVARVLAANESLQRPRIGVVCTAAPDERLRGDGWAVDHAGPVTRVMVVDGLGHGENAHQAAVAALAVFRAHPATSPGDLLADMQQALRMTRGAAVAIATLDREAATVRFAGIGNVSAMLVVGAVPRALMSHHGIVGHDTRRLQEFVEPLPASGRLVMHSDGVQSRWRAAEYATALTCDPSVLAALLFRDHGRGRDDATVLVVEPMHGEAA